MDWLSPTTLDYSILLSFCSSMMLHVYASALDYPDARQLGKIHARAGSVLHVHLMDGSEAPDVQPTHQIIARFPFFCHQADWW